jgi:hypothetical protein
MAIEMPLGVDPSEVNANSSATAGRAVCLRTSASLRMKSEGPDPARTVVVAMRGSANTGRPLALSLGARG